MQIKICVERKTMENSNLNLAKEFHGGLGSELETLGLNFENDGLWSARAIIEHPDMLKIAHKSFLNGGSNIILTASYQASIEGFIKYANCTSDEARTLMKKCVAIAREACEEYLEECQLKGTKLSQQILIGGSIGPYGACLCDRSEYHGNYIDTINLEELKMWHRPRINALVQAGVDFLAIETIPSLTEAEAILSVISDYPGVVCWIAFSCKDDKHLCHGENFCDAITVIEKFKQVEAVGINCTPSQFVEPLLSSIHKKTTKPVVVYPNYNLAFGPTRDNSLPKYKTFASTWLQQGVNVIVKNEVGWWVLAYSLL